MVFVDILERTALLLTSLPQFFSLSRLSCLDVRRLIILNVGIVIPVFLMSLIYSPNGFGAGPASSVAPPPFDPNERQHGFSEYDTMPPIPSDSPSEPSSNTLPGTSENLDQPPEGLFYAIEFAEGFEEEEGLRRGHLVTPVRPTDVFRPDTSRIFLVFAVFKHYAPYQVFGRMYPENVDGLDPNQILEEDTMYLATEDEGGYLQFFPSSGTWHPGTYRVEIYVGYEINPVNRMGTMRFSVTSESKMNSSR